jgi:hypothetical protein
MTKINQTTRVLSFLQSGSDLTENQAYTKFGIRNMSATASNLRRKGYAVYTNRKTLSNGNVATVFRLGTPSRAVVAAGYRALATA